MSKKLDQEHQAMVVFPVSKEGKSCILNVIEMGSEAEQPAILARAANVELTLDQESVVVQIIKNLPAGATIRDFLDVCKTDTAQRIGISLEMLKAISPLLVALENLAKPGQYEHIFSSRQ